MVDGPAEPNASSSPDADRALLRSFHRGDDAAARALWHRHAGQLRAYARTIAGESAADDVVQAVFLKVLKLGRGRVKAVRDPAAWLCTLTRHEALATNRGAGRAARREADTHPRANSEPLEHANLHEILIRVPEECREAVVLRHAYGFTLDRLALALGVSRSTAADRYARGLALARASLTIADPVGGHEHA